ncbi:transporter substrate-binding domain-containing protein [uncultured Paraglaciecola sp.]|uniref:transporter substrate-binding domain-containing protein n=1 Tax=uncultured Paraglaciecola sp. TaxID=1765024 RepID=UPI0025EDAC8A|nr:transporter substrate-binding domain-containing protein [uncultured Paraglaciecola sp.]
MMLVIPNWKYTMFHYFYGLAKKVIALLMFMPMYVFSDPVMEVRFPVNIDNVTYQQRDVYFNQLIKLALEHSAKEYQLISMPVPTIPEERSMKLIQEGHYNIHWMSTTANREKLLLPIYIPLDKGLIGWRLMLVHKDNKNIFSQVTSIQDFGKLTAGLGHHWADTSIFNENELSVFTATSTQSLKKMLNLKRIDYFPRSIMEIWQEHSTSDSPLLAIDSHITLTYPAAIYFFVSRDNPALHDRIKVGLELAIADGSFEKLFQQNFAEVIQLANLNKRRRFHITNSLITDLEYLNRSELWFSPSTIDVQHNQ